MAPRQSPYSNELEKVLSGETLRQVGEKESTLQGSSDSSDKAKYNKNQL
jgi:hypothetical protein